MQLTQEFKKQVQQALLDQRSGFSGTDQQYATSLGVPGSTYSKLKKGQVDGLLSDMKWLTLGREFNVGLKQSNWQVARTAVYNEIEDNLRFCKQFSKSMILVDDCGIGRSFCTRHIIRQMNDAFYIDCSQIKTKSQFIKGIARTVGMPVKGRYIEIKQNLKYYINMLASPLIVLDEAGDLEYKALLELKELWNATEGACGWYLMGADGLRKRIEQGINNERVGYAELYSRFSDEFINLVPKTPQDRQAFYQQLFRQVAEVNLKDQGKVNNVVKKCMAKSATLRYLSTLIELTNAEN
jgi:DNA transposition AAA+ family ATPase